MIDPAIHFADTLSTAAQTRGPAAAVDMAEAMIAAGTAALIHHRCARYAYGTLQQLADGIATQIISGRCGYGE